MKTTHALHAGRKRAPFPPEEMSVIRFIQSRLAVAALAAAMAFSAQAQNVTGAGASFVYPVMSKWTADYRNLTKVQVNYQSIGSGGGQRQILAQTVDFGASDQPMSDHDLQKTSNRILHVPTALGAVVVCA